MSIKWLARAFFGLALGLVSFQWARAGGPEVDDQGRVTFRLHAPAAGKVEVHCDNQGMKPLERRGDGGWAVTLGPLEPDLYGYVFFVDGVRMPDPENPSEVPVSLVLVPDRSAPRVWERTDVPRGVVHRHAYRSKVAEEEREYLVYTPPGYADGGEAYPVLYLLHGAGDGPPGWTTLGRMNVILDNLIARGAVVPMVVVMPSTFGRESQRHAPPASGAAWLDRPEIWRADADQFREILRDEIRPAVERQYRLRPGAGNRAIAGLSLGGAHTLAAALHAPGEFAWVGAFSPGGVFRVYARDFAASFPRLAPGGPTGIELLWVACGREDGLVGINREFSAWLRERKVPHRWVETPGGHDWTVWRRHLEAFTPLLFRAH